MPSLPILHRLTGHPRRPFLLLAAACLLSQSSVASLAQSSPHAQAQASFEQGLRLQHTNHLAEAQRAFEQAHALAPQDAAFATALARLDAILGRQDDAVRLFREVAAAAPAVSEHQVDVAIALATRGSLDEALGPATRAVSLNPRSTAAHHIRGKILAALNRNQEAATDFAAALQLSPADPLTLYDAALLAEATGRLPDEIALLHRLNLAVPGRAPYHFLLGRALARSGDLPAARLEYRETIRLDPENRAALYSLSRTLQAEDPAESARLAERFRALRVSEEELNTIRTTGNAGVAAMARHDWPAAVSAFQSALSACAGCTLEATLEKDLGLAQCQSGDTLAGAASLHRALALDPRDLDTLQALEIAEKANAAPR